MVIFLSFIFRRDIDISRQLSQREVEGLDFPGW